MTEARKTSPLQGRKIWLGGIGGAGMSAYAVIAKAWGADVSQNASNSEQRNQRNVALMQFG